MRIKPTVFGSGSEKELYTALHSMWSDNFNLWPSLPFLSLMDLDGDEVSPPEYEFLKKTSVDITLCAKTDDRPILSIEFDGMGHGFSRDGKYIQTHPTQDPNRKLKLDLKLRIARAVNYPLVVLSYEEKNPIGPELTLTVADGIVGQILAKKRMDELIHEFVQRKPIESVPLEFRDDYAQDIVDSAEVQAELDWNPVARLAAQYDCALGRLSLINGGGWEYLHDPPLPDLDHEDFFLASVQSVKARIRAMDEATRVGCRYVVKSRKGDVSNTVWIRNISGQGVYAPGLAQDFAKLLALKSVAEAYGITQEEVLRLNGRE
jgi:hypothetical protein